MKDSAGFVLTVIGVAAGTVAFTFGTFATQAYVRDVVLARLDRIESKLDKIMEKNDQIIMPRSLGHVRQSPPKRETNENDAEECTIELSIPDPQESPRSSQIK